MERDRSVPLISDCQDECQTSCPVSRVQTNIHTPEGIVPHPSGISLGTRHHRVCVVSLRLCEQRCSIRVVPEQPSITARDGSCHVEFLQWHTSLRLQQG